MREESVIERDDRDRTGRGRMREGSKEEERGGGADLSRGEGDSW